MREVSIQSNRLARDVWQFTFLLNGEPIAHLGFNKNEGIYISNEERGGNYSLWWSMKEPMSLDVMRTSLKKIVDSTNRLNPKPIRVLAEYEYITGDIRVHKPLFFFLLPENFVLDFYDEATHTIHEGFIGEQKDAIEFVTYTLIVGEPFVYDFMMQADIRMNLKDHKPPEVIFVGDSFFFPEKSLASLLSATGCGEVTPEEADALMEQVGARVATLRYGNEISS